MRPRAGLMVAGVAAIALGVPQCTGMPHVHASCQVYHRKAEVLVLNTGKAPAKLASMLITLTRRNGKGAGEFGDDLSKPPVTTLDHRGDSVTITVKLGHKYPGAHSCTARVNTD